MEEPSQLLVMVEGAIADPYRIILPITHTCGGSAPTEQPNAPSVTFEWLGPLTFDYGGTPMPLTVGARVSLVYDQAAGGLWSDIWDPIWSPALPVGTEVIPTTYRFTGRITDLTAAADTETLRTQVTAIGTSGEAASYMVGSQGLPAQTESQRVAQINTLTPYVIVNNGGTTALVARDPNRVGVLDALQETAESTGARVVEDGLGRIVYIGLAARRAATDAATLDELEIRAPAAWAQHVAGLLNDVRVYYGAAAVAPATERASVVVTDGASIATYGRQSIDVQTALTIDDDAAAYGGVILSHWSKAFWDAPLISVPAHLLAPAKWADLMTATLGQILTTEGVTSVPSTPTGVGRWLIEGWVQTWDRDSFGSMTNDLQLAVSELERWIADGKTDTVTTAVAAPTTAPQLSPIVVTATVKANGVAIAAGGTVEVRDGTTLLGSHAVGAGGVAAVTVKPAVGARHLTVTFTGTALYRPSSVSVAVTVTPVTATAVALSSSPTTVNAGAKVTHTATVTPVGVTGSIQWEFTRDGSGWQVWDGQDSPVSATTGKATASWTTGTAGHDYVWRARYVPTPGTSYAAALSGTVAVTVKQKTSQTLTYSAAWAATYQSDGDKRSDTSDLYQGYYSGTNGNQRSIAGMPSISGDWGGATITKVEVWLSTPHWQSAGGGTAVIGSYTSGSEPSSWPSSGVNDDRTRAAFDRGQGKWVNITSWGGGFATGALRAIVLGPGPSTSGEFYGYATGTGSDRPKVRITGESWS